MLLLRHTPYLSPSADTLALATSFALALTLLTGYVLSATSAFLKDRPEELKAAVDAMDTFLIVINVIPFVIFLLNIVWRKCCKKKNAKKGDGASDKKKKREIERLNFWKVKVHPISNEVKLTGGDIAMEAEWNNWSVHPVSNEVKLTEGDVVMENTKSSSSVVPSSVVQNGSLPALGRKKKARVRKGSIHFGD